MLELVPGSLENREQRQRMLELVDDNPSVITTVRSRVENEARRINGGNRIIRGLTYWLLVAVFRGLAETIRFQIGRPEGFTQVDIMNSIMEQNINPTIQQPGVSTSVSSDIPFSAQSSELLSDFRRANFSNFGPRVDVWAPGVEIVSTFNNQGTPDNKYGGSNYFYNIQGTSMASPQVAGVAACIATGKTRFTNSDVLGYIQQHGKYNDMTFDVNGGNFADPTCLGGNNGLYFDSSVPELQCTKTRNTGHMGGWYKDQLKGHRRPAHTFANAQMYPRTNQYYRALPLSLIHI